MKKIVLFFLLTFAVSITSFSAAASSVGVIGNTQPNGLGGSLTIGLNDIELEIALSNNYLAVSGDWNLFGNLFQIGGLQNFFWSMGGGAEVSVILDPVSVGAGLILPIEFGYRFPVVASGFDLYLQATPKFNLIDHSGNIGFDFGWGAGLGLRVQF